MEIREYEYQREKGILLKDRSTMTNVFLTDYEIIELLKGILKDDEAMVEVLNNYLKGGLNHGDNRKSIR